MNERNIKRMQAAVRDDIGDLMTQRPLPAPHLDQIDPYLFLNHHGPQVYPPNNRGLPFAPHPHRGFETVTFIAAGSLSHSDNAGHESVIGAGGVQWMTAGSGIVHAELSPEQFLRDGGPIEILQLWINLPGRLKMTTPAYIGLQAQDIPVIAEDDGKVSIHLIAGQWKDVTGPVASLTGHFMSTIAMQPGGKLRIEGLLNRSVLLYVVRGALRVGPDRASAFHLVELESEGDAVSLSAETDTLLLFGHAEAIGEPVVAHGPFVMNTRAQIEDAIRDYQAGRFGSPM